MVENVTPAGTAAAEYGKARTRLGMIAPVIIAAALLVGLAIGAPALSRQLGCTTTEAMGQATTPADVRSVQSEDAAQQEKDEFVAELRADRLWYQCEADQLQTIWLLCTIGVIVLTALSSFLIAVDFAGPSKQRRVLLASLPFAAGLMATVLSQFHIQESWELRERGRIEIIALREEVRLISAADKAGMRTALAPFRKERNELSRTQATAFFSYYRAAVKAPATADEANPTANGAKPATAKQ